MLTPSDKSIISLLALFIFIISGVITSCEDDPVIADTPPKTIVFNGITITDNNGWVIQNDPDDWKLTESWTEKENSLFVEKNVNLCDNGNPDYAIHPSHLNSSSSQFNLNFTKPAGSRFAFRIVDRNYNVLLSNDSIFTNAIVFDVQSFNIKNDTVRMYYKYLGPDCELKGHGDIKIE